MKNTLLLLFVGSFLSGCNTIFVASDFNYRIDFGKYETYAFYKPGIDEVKISDLDKQRILTSIDFHLQENGYSKSENPDFLVSINTTEENDLNINVNPVWYWSPWFWNAGYNAGQYIDASSTLYIDFIDAETGRLVWQGYGQGRLTHLQGPHKKEERIDEFVHKILSKFPPRQS
ncbi:MAG: DUF4136 domain-containing protein [Flavobacteriaceae bacterium]|nr:DUF4136 domain-containing protein [Flavobacteriaceae bacterium]